MGPRGAYRSLQPAFTAFGARLTIYTNPTTLRTFSTLRLRPTAACTACLRRQVPCSLFRVDPYHRSFSSVRGSSSDDDETKEIAAILTQEEPRYNALPNVEGHDELTPRAKAIGDCVGRWLKDVVIGLKLCPWAATVLNNHGVQIMVYEGKELEGLLHAVMAEAMRLAEIRDQAAQETVLIAVPDAFAGQPFQEFIQFDKIIKDCFGELKIRGKVQLAIFHPEFQFGDSDPGAVDNYTNRSPVPIFHLLREEEVSRAVAGFPGDTKTVWKRNKELMNMLGEDKIRALLDKCKEGMPADVITASADADFSDVVDDSGGDESRGDAIEGDESRGETSEGDDKRGDAK